MSDKALKRIILALNIVLFGGLLAFSIIFYAMAGNVKVKLEKPEKF
mgnify:CR=1 FL=1